MRRLLTLTNNVGLTGVMGLISITPLSLLTYFIIRKWKKFMRVQVNMREGESRRAEMLYLGLEMTASKELDALGSLHSNVILIPHQDPKPIR